MQSHGINIGGTVTIQVGPSGQRPVNVLVFPVNPDQVKALNIRTTVVQTDSGIYLDRFGAGVQTVNISGTTAWSSPIGRFNGQKVDGNTASKHLYVDIFLYYQKQVLVNPNTAMEIFNDVTGDAWVVEPINAPSFQRTSQSALVEYFSADFVIVKDLSTGHQVQKISDPVVKTFKTLQSTSQYAITNTSSAQKTAISVKQTPYTIRTVQVGETAWTIAQNYLPKQATQNDVQTFVDEITSLNNLSNPDLIFAGLNLKIPSG